MHLWPIQSFPLKENKGSLAINLDLKTNIKSVYNKNDIFQSLITKLNKDSCVQYSSKVWN